MTKVDFERRSKGTKKFEDRRREILDVASAQINALGAQGMTLTGVARELGLDTSSVTYYFRKKDDLAFACLERSLLWMREQAALAAGQESGFEVARTFLNAHLSLNRTDYPVDAPKLALLSDLHSMRGDRRGALKAIYAEAAMTLRAGLGIADPSRSLIATLVLLAVVHWLPSWVGGYADADMSRVEARLLDIIANGLALPPLPPSDMPLPEEPGGLEAQARFLHAATALINRDGYHGASVEKIAAKLGVSTGSFYHHLQTKDELVVACFERSFALIDRARVIGEQAGGDCGHQLAVTAASLFRLQLEGHNPLLRTNAYQALPLVLRKQMLHRTRQMTRHFAGTIADGIAEGSIRAVDPAIASRFFVSVINAAADSRDWPSDASPSQDVSTYSSIVQTGIFGSATE